jgi:hypothetical protein
MVKKTAFTAILKSWLFPPFTESRLSPMKKTLPTLTADEEANEDTKSLASLEPLPILLDAEQWVAFVAALDAPPRHCPRLDRLLNEPSVFEKMKA